MNKLIILISAIWIVIIVMLGVVLWEITTSIPVSSSYEARPEVYTGIIDMAEKTMEQAKNQGANELLKK